MPTSRSPNRAPNQRAAATPAVERARFIRPLIVIAIVAVLLVALIALPASLVNRFLPPNVRALDFSGTLWHGSAGNIAVNSRDAGAIEWHLHPWSLAMLTLSADLHWVKVGFVGDANVDVSRHGITAHDVQGSGPIEDLHELGVAAGWHGTTRFKFSELQLTFDGGAAVVRSAVGDIAVTDLASPQVADGADLGGYALHIANGAVTPDADAAAELTDTGGPLEVQAVIHFSAKDHTGLLSGTVKERASAPPALRGQLENLAQLHARDAQGRIPVELEFTL
jgi:Type II secretion system (T2SS), protein N